MHDFHIADQITKLVVEYANKNNLTKVTKIVVELGKVEEHKQIILPENLEFNIKLLLKNTLAKEAVVDIILKEGDSWTLKEIEGDT